LHILVEPSTYDLRNAGDLAMQQVAVTRVANLWPDASILVLTDVPDELSEYGTNVHPLDAGGRRAWLTRAMEQIERRRPAPLDLLRRLAGTLSGSGRGDRDASTQAREFVHVISTASLVVVSGMGSITDAFPCYAASLLKTLELATRAGIPTAMMGQGMGPLRDDRLRHLARAVLPNVDLIALREVRASYPLLRELGVSPDRILTTGDDAIEIAYHRDPPPFGTLLGVNLRAAYYSEVGADSVAPVKSGLAESAHRLAASLVPIPISHVPGEEDALTIAQVVGEHGLRADATPAPADIDAVVERIRRCRVIVTGSYHAGVFALAAGIPVVALARSTYYIDKFLGLADQFGGGCDLVVLEEPDIAGRLVAAVDGAWREAERVRPKLLEAAARQIQLGHVAYRRVCELVQRRHDGTWRRT
jgi:polysaccharide pyruvyl transferase WcaK-like protein